MSQNRYFSDDNTEKIFQKEKEWKDLLLDQLENTKIERFKAENLLSEFQEKFYQLEIDFKHNLNLLEERDKEINELEQENSTLRECVYDNEEKISLLSVDIDKLRVELKTVNDIKEDLRTKIKQIIDKAHNDIQTIKNEKVKDIERMKDENASKVKELERKIIQLESESKENQYALMADVEETLRSREGEMKRKTEQVHSEMLNYELKYRLASKELDLIRSSKVELLRNLTEKENIIRELEMKLGEIELISKSEISIEKMKRDTEALNSKEREANLLKEIEKLGRKINDKNEKLKNKVDIAKRLESEIRVVMDKAKENEIEKDKEKEMLELELEKIESKNKELENLIEKERELLSVKNTEIARLVSRMTEENSKKEGELRNMKLEMDNLIQQLRTKQEEMLELRNELEYAVCKDLEMSKKKLGEKENWETKIERVRIEEMAKVEGMIKTITKSRDENFAEVQELRKQLEEKKQVRLCSNCSNETVKEQVFKESKDQQILINEMNKQNKQLKEIIAQMTEEATRQANDHPKEIVSNNRHIATLAERNRQLQQEKIDLLATSRKLQARLEATETDNNNMKRIVRERETEISQVKFELDSLQRHTGMDVRTMRRTLQELETELSVSRKEAEEYYKGNLELGRVIEDLQAELTFLKSEQIDKVPTLNFGAQEMLIEQLKKEIKELREKLVFQTDIGTRPLKDEDKESIILRRKLKAAANQIRNLASEKQVLIQISNRLRSELKLAGIKLPIGGNNVKCFTENPVENDGNKDIKRTINDLEDKLSKLEQLQKNLKISYMDEENIKTKSNLKSSRDIISSVGRQSVDEVFKLLDDSDSLGQSSVLDNDRNLPMKTFINDKSNNNFLFSKSVKLNTPRVNTKRNMVTKR